MPAARPAPNPPTSKASAGKPPVGGRLRTLKRVAAFATVAFFVLPPLQCLLLRWLDPPVTLTMLSRVAGHAWDAGELAFPDHATVPLRSLPRGVPVAAITSEDRGFFFHYGFDLPAIRRAWRRYQSDKPGRKLVGGSTISQQVARNAFLWQHRSWLRKGLEAWYTVWLEVLVPKERILEVYVNIAEMGPMVFGVEAAAQHWFRKPARQLKPHEAARIVAILPAPRRWTPASAVAARRAGWIAANPVRVPW